MFWDSVLTSLGTLANWQTYAAAALFLVLSIGPVVAIGLLMSNSGKAGGAVGCLSMLLIPFVQTFALVVFVLTLSPIMLRFSQEAAWLFPWQLVAAEPWFVAKLVGKLLLAAVVLAFIPILGKLQSLHTLLLGSLALGLVIGLFEHVNPTKSVSMWPGFWFVVGLVVVGSALAWVGMVLTALIAAPIEARFEGLGHLIALPVTAALGFIPLFVYAAWLGLHMRGAQGV
ncbi:MAG: hypothetical protein KF892_24070 [Rhizobacter sp.]|nr:hypothetical protein [Rhizobacter sp.]